jgi:hypothetical protein
VDRFAQGSCANRNCLMLVGCYLWSRLTRTSSFAHNVYIVSAHVGGVQEHLHSRMRCFSYSPKFSSSSSLKKVGNGVYTPGLRIRADEWCSAGSISGKPSWGFAVCAEKCLSFSLCSGKRNVLAGQQASGKVTDEAACYQRPPDSLSQNVRTLTCQIGRRAALIHTYSGKVQRLRYADNSYNID